ncbi:MAG TPA: helix-turn-helix transcriptional regulator [Thermoanaerobaculia bacterium]|nr:helix-turn-helix transcriptional regulator [Thermoanaerobaculia bacterium]
MDPSGAAQPEGQQLAQALRRKIREAGLSYGEVERRLGMGKDTLRHILSGRVELKVKHLYGVLGALGIEPAQFFAEHYGLLTPLQAANQNHHPHVPSLSLIQSAAIWFIARRLKEKGILAEDEMEAFVTEHERKASAP